MMLWKSAGLSEMITSQSNHHCQLKFPSDMTRGEILFTLWFTLPLVTFNESSDIFPEIIATDYQMKFPITLSKITFNFD